MISFFIKHLFTVRAGFSFLFPGEVQVTAGAQAEHTQMGFNFIKGNSSDVQNNYWNVYCLILRCGKNSAKPEYFIELPRHHPQPGIGELNPNIDYSDPYNLRLAIHSWCLHFLIITTGTLAGSRENIM
jgi:ferric enterobactin receptor